jgi:archaellum component FlaC
MLLTYFGAPSTYPPGGSGGRRVLIPVDVGAAALDTIVGMAVNASNTLSKHAPQQKLGVVEKAWMGDALESGAVPVYVSGYLYEADFPDLIAEMRDEKDDLGGSYEIKDAKGFVNGDNLLELSSFWFTGATILYADKAAYANTSFAAEKEDAMNEDQIRELLAGMFGSKLDEALNAFEEFKKQFEGDGKYASLSIYLSAAADAEAKVNDLATKVDELTTALSAANSTIETLTNELNAAKEATLNASAEQVADSVVKALQAQVDEMKTKVDTFAPVAETLKAEAEARESYQRKSKPVTLMAKYEVGEIDSLEAAIAAIEKRTDLDIEERLALKMEARAKYAK